jgi:Zn-dependent protease with chaperone function
MKKVWSVLVGMCLLVLFTSCASIDEGMMAASDAITTKDAVTGSRELNFTSDEAEIKDATETTSQLLKSAKQKGLKIDADLPEYAQIIKIFNRLKKVTHRQQLPWEIHELGEDKNFNAFTVGGGKIFIFSGLFNKEYGVRGDDELATVIAHEMGHVSARHVSESQAKMIALKIADEKAAARGTLTASFTTIQEDEADRLAALYSALAGFDPEAGAAIWSRVNKKFGSNAGGLLYDHPLSDDRANNVKNYASKTKQYFTQGEINPDHVAILENNALFQKKNGQEMKAGEGGGFIALLETAANAYVEDVKAKSEEVNRQNKQVGQTVDAMRIYQLTDLKIQPARGGGRGIFANITNSTNKNVEQATGRINYLLNGQVIYQEPVRMPLLAPYASQQIGYMLKPIQYDSISVVPTYIKFVGE